MVDRAGIPLGVRLTPANTHDSKAFEETLNSIVPIKSPAGKRGRRRTRPDKVHADKAYDIPRCRMWLRQHGIRCRIARKGIESNEKLGRYRWVVERTLAWLARYRRLAVRYERLEAMHAAFLHLGCALICLNYLR